MAFKHFLMNSVIIVNTFLDLMYKGTHSVFIHWIQVRAKCLFKYINK